MEKQTCLEINIDPAGKPHDSLMPWQTRTGHFKEMINVQITEFADLSKSKLVCGCERVEKFAPISTILLRQE